MAVRAVTIGELLFDVFPDGERLGGAPSNFAYHVAAMGARSSLVSAVGNDARGAKSLEFLSGAGVLTAGVRQTTEAPTGVVQVSLANGQPAYDIVEDVAWDQIDILPETEAEIQKADLVCWGTLGQRSCRSREAHRQLFALVPESSLRVCDLNFRQHYHSKSVVLACLRRAGLLKINDEEIPILRSYVGGPCDHRDFLRDVRHRFEIDTIVLTLGGRGCRVSAANVDFSVPGENVKVVNTVGAGDAFTAAFSLRLLSGSDLRSCAEHANRVGAFVATQDGGMSEMPSTFRSAGDRVDR